MCAIFAKVSLNHSPLQEKTVPIAGEIETGAPSGTTNSNDVGPTGNISPEPILGTGCVN